MCICAYDIVTQSYKKIIHGMLTRDDNTVWRLSRDQGVSEQRNNTRHTAVLIPCVNG